MVAKSEVKSAAVILLGLAALGCPLRAQEHAPSTGDANGPVRYKIDYATFIGGTEYDDLREVILLEGGSVLLTGVTASTDFPVTARAFQRTLKGQTNGFLTKLTPDGPGLVFSTFLGGSGGEYFLMPTTDPQGNIYVVGHTASKDSTRKATSPAWGLGHERGRHADCGRLRQALTPSGRGSDSPACTGRGMARLPVSHPLLAAAMGSYSVRQRVQEHFPLEIR